MSVYERDDSKFWWLYLETTKRKERTEIPVGDTRQQRTDSRRLAEALYHKRMAEHATNQHGLGPRPAVTFATFAKWYDTNVVARHKGAGRERQILPGLIRYFGKSLLTEIDKKAVIEWRTHRLTTPTVVEHFGGPKGKRRVLPAPSPRTVNRETTVLKQVLAAAVPEYLTASPITRLPNLKYTKPLKREMTPDEEAKLLAALRNPADRAIFLIAVDMLVRLGDIIDLRTRDDHGTHLEICDPKQRPYPVPFSPRVRAALDALPSTAGDYLFPHRRTAETIEERSHAFGTMIRRAARRAGVPWGKKAGGNTFHWGTRRTGATRLLRDGVDPGVVAAIGGWKDPTMLLKEYQAVTLADMQAGIARLHAAPAPVAKAKKKRRAA